MVFEWYFCVRADTSQLVIRPSNVVSSAHLSIWVLS